MATGYDVSKKSNTTVESVSKDKSIRKEVRTTSILMSREELRLNPIPGSGDSNRVHYESETDTSQMQAMQTNESKDMIDKINELTARNERQQKLLEEKDKEIDILNNKLDTYKTQPMTDAKKRSSEAMSKALIEIGQLLTQEADFAECDELFSTPRNSGITKLKESSIFQSGQESGEISADAFDELVIAMRSLLARRRLEIEHLKGKLSTSNEQVIQPRNDKQMEKCRKEILALKEEIAALRTDNESAEKTRDVMTEKIIQLENIRNDLENDLWLLKRSKKGVKLDAFDKQANTQFSSQVTDSAHTSSAFVYQEEASSQSTFLDQVENALKEQVDALNEENEKLHQMASDFRRGREVLEDELEDMRSKERNYIWEMEQKGQQLMQLGTQLENSKKELMTLKEEIAALKIDKEYAEKSRDEFKNNVAQLEGIRSELDYELSALKTSEISLKSSLNREQQQNEELIAERDLFKQDSIALRAKNTQLMSDKVTLQSQLEQNQNEILSLSSEIDESTRIKNELETRLKQYDENETKLKQEYEDSRQEMEKQLFKLNSEFIELNRRLNEVGKEAEKLNKEKNEYKALCQEVRREKSNCDLEIKELMNRISSDNEEKQHLEQQLASVRIKKSELQRQNEILERFNKDLQNEIENIRKDLTKHKTEIEEMRKDRVTMASKANEIQRQFEAKLQKERMALIKQCDSLKHELEMEKVSSESRNEEVVNQLKVEKEKQIGEYQEELSKLRLEIKVNEQQYSEKFTQLEREKLNFEIQSQREKNALTASLSEKEAKLNYKLSEIEETSKKLKEVEALKNKLEAKLGEMEITRRQESNNHQQTVASLNIQLSDLRNEKFILDEEKNSLSLQLQREKEERVNLAKNLKQTTDQMNELAFNYDKLKESDAELRAQINAIEKEIRVKEEKINSLTSMLNVKEEECLNLLQSIKNNEKKLADEENLKEDLIKDMNELRSSLMEMEKSRLELKKQISNNNVFQKSLENELKAKAAIIEEMNVIIEKRDEKDEQKQEELNKLKNFVIELDTEKQALKSEIVNIRHKFNDCEHLLILEKNMNSKQDEELRRVSLENSQFQFTISKYEEELKKAKNLKIYEQKVTNLEAKISKLLKDKRVIDDALFKINSAIRNCLKLNPVITSISADNIYSNLLDLLSKLNAINEEKESLKLQQKSFESFLRNIKDSNASLTLRNESLEDEVRRIRKDAGMLMKEVEDLKTKNQKQEEALQRIRIEKKHECERVANLKVKIESLEKDKEKLMKDTENRRIFKREEVIESQYLIENKVKFLETTKKSLDSRINELSKQLTDVNIENDTLKQEITILNKTVRELQGSNLKLHSALSDSNIALKRSSEEEQELKRKVFHMSESIEDHDRVSRDVVLHLRTLKSKIDELTTERTFLQQSLDANRESFVNLSNTNRRLKHRIEQLDAELNLTVSKMRSNESLLNAKSTALMEKEALIKKLQQDLKKMDESYNV